MSFKSYVLFGAVALFSGCNGSSNNNNNGSDADTDADSDADSDSDTDLDPGGDEDGDGLTNGDEEDAGTDPTKSDSDDDGYSDPDEMCAETDPTDGESVVYTGGWPFYCDKEDIHSPGFIGSPEVGGEVPRLKGYDQYGEKVDLYDYAFQGKPIMIDLSAEWCGPCNQLSDWLSGASVEWLDGANDIRDMVDNGELLWITIMYQDINYDESTWEVCERWDEKYTNEHIAVVTDPSFHMVNFVEPPGVPSVSLIDQDMTWLAVDDVDASFSAAYSWSE